jgi:hypothetical protein
MLKFHLGLPRLAIFIVSITILAIVTLVIREIHIMHTISNITDPQIKLRKVDGRVNLFNLVSLIALLITFIAGLFLMTYTVMATKMRDEKITTLSTELIEARNRIITLTDSSIYQSNRLGNTETELDKTENETQTLKNKNLELANSLENAKKDNLILASNLEQEKQKTLQMQKDLAPRFLEQAKSSASLKRFGNFTVIIKYIPGDHEIYRFVGMINFMVSNAGWKFKDILAPPNKFIPDGVTFHVYGNAIPEIKGFYQDIYPLEDSTFFEGDIQDYEYLKSEHIFNVADQLVQIFKDNDIEISKYSLDEKPQQNTIYMNIGYKPNNFFAGDTSHYKGRQEGGNMTY